MKKYVVIEDESTIFNGIVEQINKCNLELKLCINGPTTMFNFTEYYQLLEQNRPEIIILDQKLRWRDGVDKDADAIINAIPVIYYGIIKPTLILTSEIALPEMVTRFNALNNESKFFEPYLNLFIVTTQSILMDKQLTSGITELKQSLCMAIDYINCNTQYLPPTLGASVTNIQGATFYHYKDKEQPLNSINICFERLLCFLYTSNQRKGYIIYFDTKGNLNIYRIRFSLDMADFKQLIITNCPEIKNQKRIFYNPVFYDNKFLHKDLNRVVHHSLKTSGFFDYLGRDKGENEIITTLKEWGMLTKKESPQ